MTKPAPLDKAVDDLAQDIAREARKNDTPLAEKVDALRVLIALDAQKFKQKQKTADEDDGEPTMEDLAHEINGAQHGRTGTRVRDH